MNTRDLDYFVALVELKNFSQVGARFKVTQPTITLALKRLEQHFNCQLIRRDQSRAQLTLTPAGEALYHRAQVISRQLHLAEKELAVAAQPKLRFGLPPINGSFFLPKLAPQLVATGLMPIIQTIEAGSEDLLNALRAGDLDLALLGSDGPLVAGDLDVQPLFSSPFAIVMAEDHPLAQHQALTFAQLTAEPFISLESGFVHAQAFSWFSQTTGVAPQTVYQTANVTLLKQLVHAGIGIALLTGMAILPQDGLISLPLIAANQPRFCVSLVTRRDQRQTPAMTQLLALIQSNSGGF